MSDRIVNVKGQFGWYSSSFMLKDAIETKIETFSKLPAGWHYGEGVAPSRRAINAATAWNRILRALGFQHTDAFSGIAGEILVTAYHGDHQIEVVVEPD